MNYYESLRSQAEHLVDGDTYVELDGWELRDLEAFAYEMGYVSGDIIDIPLWIAWLDKKIAEEQA